MICKECLRCSNYMVSELGCYGGFSPCNSEIQISYDDTYNPSLKSPNSTFEQPFYQTRDSFTDIDYYKRFLENCISRFRHSKTYKNYKH